MLDIVIIWDDQDDPDGNYWHICVEGHGLTTEEVEEVLRDDESENRGEPILRPPDGIRLDLCRRTHRRGV